MSPLPHPDGLHADAAVGWLMLGDARSALDELRRLRPESQVSPAVLRIAWDAHARLGDWESAWRTGELWVSAAPDQVGAWIQRAYALRRKPGGGLPQAREALAPALERFPGEHLVAFNLACYAAQLGELEVAWNYFERALRVAQEARQVLAMALADSDLQPLWPRIRAVGKR